MPRYLPILLAILTATAGAQTFTDVAAFLGWPSSGDNTRGLAWADFDGDGDFDVYLQNQGSSSRLLRNDGTTFTNVTSLYMASHPSSGWSAAWGDYDNDGKPDLYTGNYQDNNLFLNRHPLPFQDTAATSGAADAAFAQSVVWVDHDGDGDLDLYVTMEFAPHRFFENLGDGTFADVSAAAGLDDAQSHSYGVTWGDWDGDGDPDCFVSTCGPGTVNRLFRNDSTAGAPSFAEIATAAGVDYTPNSYGAEWVDLDNDGDLDLFVAGTSGEPNHLYRNDGVLPMVDVAAASGIATPVGTGHGIALGDYDNDGLIDIYIQDAALPNRLYRNLGGLQFTLVAGAAGANDSATSGYDCAFVDFDNDGDLDIHASRNGRDRLYQNSGNGNHWLQVIPVGTADNRSAIGVTVEIVVAGVSQHRLMNAGAGAFSQNLLPAHFGLGAATVVDQVIVHWRDGTTDTLTAVPGDQRITITQSSGLAASTLVGSGCSGGGAPILTTFGLPTLGNGGFSLAVFGAAPNAPFQLLAATGTTAIGFDPGHGCLVHLELTSALALLAQGVNPVIVDVTSAIGAWNLALPVPNDHVVAGLHVGLQGIIVDPGAPQLGGVGIATTNALDLTFGY